MGLFERKLDYSKDSLMIKFDLDTKSYRMNKWNEFIPEKKLNKETRNFLIEYNKRLEDKELLSREIKKAEVYRKQLANHDKRHNELRELEISNSSFTVMGFEPGHISNEVFDYLYPILSEENVVIGIHRTGGATMEDIENIFKNGFNMSGHGYNVVQHGGVPLYENFGIYEENMRIMDELAYASGYKHSSGSILVRLPDEDIKNGKIFDQKVGKTTITRLINNELKKVEVDEVVRKLKTEYIIGYVPVDENFNIDKIILNPNYGKDKTKEILATELVEKESSIEQESEIKAK